MIRQALSGYSLLTASGATRMTRLEEYFGPNAGYAQQYLFHYIRTQTPKKLSR